MSENVAIDFDALTEHQQIVLGMIATGQDGGHHPRTLASLLRRGLIEKYEEGLAGRIPAGRIPVTSGRYFVPFPVHIQWCEWCSLEEDDQ